MARHESVLLNEVRDWLRPSPGKNFIDGTLGLGGHAKIILECTAPDGLLIGFDKDPFALAQAKEVLASFGERVMFIHDDFQNIADSWGRFEHSRIHGVLLDLGVSSPQLDTAERGFSFKAKGPLDMRMNPESSLTAEKVVNEYSQEQLLNILWKLGEERYARRIVDRILRERARKRIETTLELEGIVFGAVPKSARYGRIHPATRTFQALRLVVNKEIEALEAVLPKAADVLTDGGRLAVISFHSLEDRVVKNSFRSFGKEKIGSVLTKKPVTPTDAEIDQNPRSRSAKMRVFEKSQGGAL